MCRVHGGLRGLGYIPSPSPSPRFSSEMELYAEWRNCMGKPGEMELLAGCTIFMVGGWAWARGGMAPQGDNTRRDRLPAPGSPCRGDVGDMALGDRAPIGRPRIGTPRPCGYLVIRYGAIRARAGIRLSDRGRSAPVRLGRQ